MPRDEKLDKEERILFESWLDKYGRKNDNPPIDSYDYCYQHASPELREWYDIEAAEREKADAEGWTW